MKIPDKCPHCHHGTLKDERGKGYGWHFSCQGGCGRVWIILDEKYWLAGFDTAGEIWEIREGKIITEILYKSGQRRELSQEAW